jgi:prepilin-type N-terminal cleavage/methylation domain-containing protein
VQELMRSHTTSAVHRGAVGRAGFTLVELMVSLVMFGIVSGIIIGMIRAQQRFYRGATEVIDVRSQLRQAAAVMPLDLRSVSTVSQVAPASSPYQPSVLGSDIAYMNDREIGFRATYGSGVVCKVSGMVVTTTPLTLVSGAVMTSWSTDPAINDTIFIFDPGALSGAVDDQWRPYSIAGILKSVPPAAGPCAASPLLTPGNAPAGDANREQWSFTLAPVSTSPVALPASIGSGSVMRFTRSVIYGLYEAPSAGSGKWYLGYKGIATQLNGVVYTAGAMAGTFEPISGPYRSWATGGATNGLALTYVDSAGATTTLRDRVARVDITLRGQGDEFGNTANNTSKKNNAKFVDSLQLSIALRNRS